MNLIVPRVPGSLVPVADGSNTKHVRKGATKPAIEKSGQTDDNRDYCGLELAWI